MKFAYILYGIKLKMLFRLTRKNRFSFRHPYLLRFLFLFQNALWSSFFSILEKIIYQKKTGAALLKSEPVIIIGNWRTGSTYLHQLLQQDPHGTTPTYFQVLMPDSFLISEKLYKPVMNFFMGKKATRPFDNVSVSADEPQEDEFALFKMCGHSPLAKLIYPDSAKFFLAGFPDFELTGRDYEEWKDAMTAFCKKIDIATSKRVILKNPFHSLRINTILKLFPGAKFIHIYRHPYNVIPSTINMWNIVGRQNVMTPGFVQATVSSTVEVFDRVVTYINKNTENLPVNSYCEIKYEDLEKDPVTEIKKAYLKLRLPFDPAFEEAIDKRRIKSFKKNKFTLSDEDKNFIYEKLQHHFTRYGYLKTDA